MEFNCHTIYPINPPVVLVRQWKTKKDPPIDHYFVGSNYPPEIKAGDYSGFGEMAKHTIIFEPLFKDDNIQTILLKIIKYLDIDDPSRRFPYVWSGATPLRFNITVNRWEEGYDVNPFNADKKSKCVLPDIQLVSNKIAAFDVLEFVSYADFEKLKAPAAFEKYYFPTEKDTFNKRDIAPVIHEQSLLVGLWNTPVDAHQNMIRQSVCSYDRAFLSAIVRIEKPYIALFKKLVTSKLIPFIQFFDDINTIQYKVYKEHTITPTLSDLWMSLDQMTLKHSITMYSFIKNSETSYMKFVLNGEEVTRKKTGDRTKKLVQVSYYINNVENIGHDTLQNHLNSVIDEIKKQLKIEIDLAVDRLAIKTSIQVRNVNLTSLGATFTSLPMIFNVPSTNPLNKNRSDLLHARFIRVPKYGNTTNIIDLIKTKIELNIGLEDIITELQEFGIEKNDVIDYFEQIQKADEIPKEKRKKTDFNSLGVLVNITSVALGVSIYINNASSFEEIQHALFWIRCAVHKWESENKRKKSSSPPAPPPPQRLVSASPSVSAESEKAKTESDFNSSGSIMSIGGAAGKENKGVFKDILDKIDPDIFAKTKGYARKCGASDLRQPLGMTLAQKAKIDSEGYGDGYDNYIVHGSDPNNPNVYMCPRIYCPVSQVPLTAEKYEALGNKCPKGEDAILMYTSKYWHNALERPHYVGFIKETGYKDNKLPCCFIKQQENLKTGVPAPAAPPPPSASAPASESVPKGKKPKKASAKEIGYIINTNKQLSVDAFGTIPESLHELLYADVPYISCKTTVKGRECILRRGIVHGTDTLMESIAYLLGFADKQSICEHIEKQLDPFTFITLENGNVYEYFMPTEATLLENNLEKLPALKAWLNEHKAYVKLFNLDEIMPYLDEVTDMPEHIQYKISRQIMIHTSYTRFIAYLYDGELKNPYMLYDLIHHIGAVLIVWNRDTQDVSTMRCPYTTKNKAWYNGSKFIPYIMIFHQDTYYEPLVIVDQNKKLSQKISFTHFDKLEKLVGACPAMMAYEDKQINDLYSLTKWIEIIISQPKYYKVFSLMLTAHDTVKGCFLTNNIYIDFPNHFSMFSIKALCERCDISKILYWEDIQGAPRTLVVSSMDTFKYLKIKTNKIGFRIQRIENVAEKMKGPFSITYTIPSVVYLEKPKIPLTIKGTFITESDVFNKTNTEWRKLKKKVMKTLLKEYDSIVLPILKYPKHTQITKLLKSFKKESQTRTGVILEELDYYDKALLEKAVNDLIYEKPYYANDTIIHEGHKKQEWIFSQKAVERNLVDNIKYPTKIYRPRGEPKTSNEDITPIKLAEDDAYPDLLNVALLELNDIPTKWRSQKLKEYKVGTLPTYSSRASASMIEMVQWFAKQKGITLDSDDLIYYLRKQVDLMLDHPETFETIIEDPAMRTEWNRQFGRKNRSIRETIDNGFLKKTTADLKKYWREISISGNLMFQDLDLYNVSKLLNVNFLILHRGRNTAGARSGIRELVTASKFIITDPKEKWLETPLFIFFKSETTTHSVYSILVGKNNTIAYFVYGHLAPQDFKTIIKGHLEEPKSPKAPKAPKASTGSR